MIFRIVTAVCLLIAAYAAFEWGRLKWLDYDAITPAAPFLVMADGGGPAVTLVMDYRCGNCHAVYRAFDALMELRPEFTYIVRPVPFIDTQSEELVGLVIAAGVQGHFTDIHRAFTETTASLSPSFIRETFSLYGLDEERTREIAQSEAVSKLIADNLDDVIWFGGNSVPSLIVDGRYHRLPDPIDAITPADLLPLLAQGD